MAYPKLILHLTDGDKEKNISIDHVKSDVTSQNVKKLGIDLAKIFPAGTSYVTSEIIKSEEIGKNS